MATNRVRVVDKGMKALMRKVRKAAGTTTRLTVGVHQDAGRYPNGIPVPKVALMKELGLGASQKAFVRPTFDETRSLHLPALRAAMSQLFVEGGSHKVALKAFGTTLAAAMKEKAPVLTGRLRASIKAVVT